MRQVRAEQADQADCVAAARSGRQQDGVKGEGVAHVEMGVEPVLEVGCCAEGAVGEPGPDGGVRSDGFVQGGDVVRREAL